MRGSGHIMLMVFVCFILPLLIVMGAIVLSNYIADKHVQQLNHIHGLNSKINNSYKEIIRLRKNIEYKNKKLRELRYAYRQITENQSFDEGQR